MKPTAVQLERLVALRHNTGCSDETCEQLATFGLVTTGRSRFGAWARLTEAGQQYVDRMSAQRGVGLPSTRGTGDTVQLTHAERVPQSASTAPTPPGGVQRVAQDPVAAPKARRHEPVISPPTGALNVRGDLSICVASQQQELAAKDGRQGCEPAVDALPPMTPQERLQRALASATQSLTLERLMRRLTMKVIQNG
jgi:hypothetical protein